MNKENLTISSEVFKDRLNLEFLDFEKSEEGISEESFLKAYSNHLVLTKNDFISQTTPENEGFDKLIINLTKGGISEVYVKIDIEKAEGARGGKVIGHTRSGKPIYENNNHESHKDFTHSDHHDAAQAHLDETNKLANHYSKNINKLNSDEKQKVLKQASKHKEAHQVHADESHKKMIESMKNAQDKFKNKK